MDCNEMHINSNLLFKKEKSFIEVCKRSIILPPANADYHSCVVWCGAPTFYILFNVIRKLYLLKGFVCLFVCCSQCLVRLYRERESERHEADF